mmetsp:Transcript_39307/g.99062  ORF Transcript_39307/g.99062 Transcript_39307/m.99062 type:complete len:280 (-) Transcript_39307:1742-2581(-)
MAGTRSVPTSTHRMRNVDSGSGIWMTMNSRKGTSSGMLDDSVYAMDFLRLSKMRRPSSTPRTMDAKLSSSRIMSAASLDTSDPVMPMAMPMSAFFSAGESFTPSPVTATTDLARWLPSTITSFCCGEVRANTIWGYSSTRSRSSSDMSLSCEPVTTMALAWLGSTSSTGTPRFLAMSSTVSSVMMFTCRAIALAVMGWSPVTMMTLMPAVWQIFTASGTAGRGGSMSAMKPRKWKPSMGKFTGSSVNSYPAWYTAGSSSYCAKPSTRSPLPPSSSYASW